jgi:hypothetical protein
MDFNLDLVKTQNIFQDNFFTVGGGGGLFLELSRYDRCDICKVCH